MNLKEIIAEYGPLTLTEAVRNIKTEPFVLTERLGQNVVRSPNETCVFEVEEGTYNLAPIGYNGDPASNVNVARRRVAQNEQRGVGSTDFETVLADIVRRDAYDSGREASPLAAADDAVHIDSSDMTIEEVVDRICDLAAARMG